jgi:S1-C subfamily serine protease
MCQGVGISSSPAVSRISDEPLELHLNGVIKVYSTVSPPNFQLPWQNKPLKEITGSGFVIPGQRILTNAHVVADQKFVMVRKHGSPDRIAARVVAVGHECDLALLAVDDASFFQDLEALEFGDIPHLEEEVTVVGYPTGGDNISVTRGVVSRVEPQQYAHGFSTLLAIQIDAAINPGNSGGPALQGKNIVGVAFQNLSDAENIGFIIPVPIIRHFLKDVERHQAAQASEVAATAAAVAQSQMAVPTADTSPGRRAVYQGFCTLGVQCQAMENPHLRAFKKMSPNQVESARLAFSSLFVNLFVLFLTISNFRRVY